ncbi:2-phosphosulfolactate phosphatase [Desulfovibrio sp. TomC]|uniref:2-phosphosulfolactate phosphatase n=1 Tax=Desulfovibrio sp. TomC TaxID=1562888 RepID=UPI0005BB82F5|nr:2-phosphosulfolactate phosphatase [Desulfovibrio sp. TomC]
MRIKMLELLSGAAEASGVAVVIDVFRACSVACYAFAGGATRILPVDSVEEALALRAAHPDYLLAGERQCLKPAGFDFGNSPSEVAAADLAGRTLVHATSAGTRGLVAAMGSAERVLTCSFVNMAATAAELLATAPPVVSVVAMGKAGLASAPEDRMCGMYLANLLQDVPNAFAVIPQFLRKTASAEIFFGDTAIVPEADFDLCLTLDAFDFYLEAIRQDDGRLALVRRDAPTQPRAAALPSQV